MPAPAFTPAPKPAPTLYVICAWCHAVIRRPASSGSAPPPPSKVSHGICARCAQALEEDR